MFNKEALLWAAGLLEGEGCFSAVFRKDRQRFIGKIECNMTDRDVLISLSKRLGIGKVYKLKLRPPHKPVSSWVVSKQKDVISLCVALYPYMHSRRQEAIGRTLSAALDGLYHSMIGRYKSYLALSPDGKKVLIKNMPEFCRRHGLCASAMYKVFKGNCKHHKRWSRCLTQ